MTLDLRPAIALAAASLLGVVPFASAHDLAEHLSFDHAETTAIGEFFPTFGVASPDGKQLYVATNQPDAGESGTVLVLARDAATGGLSFQSSFPFGSSPSGPAPMDIELSSAGSELYVPLQDRDGIVARRRDPITGNLSYLPITGWPTNGINNPFGVYLSPDDRFLYVNSGFDSGLAIFEYDPMEEGLAFSEFQNLADAFNKLRNVHWVGASPDGAHLYLVWRSTGNALSVWTASRDAESGRVAITQTTSSIPGGARVFHPNRLFVSPDGKHVYMSLLNDGLGIFSRDAATGALSYESVTTLPTASGNAFVQGMVFDASGEHMYATMSNNVYIVALLALHRDTGTGAVSIVDEETLSDSSGSPVLSPDGAHLYAIQGIPRAIRVYQVPEAATLWLGLSALLTVSAIQNGRRSW